MATVFTRLRIGMLARSLLARGLLTRILSAPLLLTLLLLALLQACAEPAGNADTLDPDGSWTFVNYWATWCKRASRKFRN